MIHIPQVNLVAVLVGAVYNQFMSGFLYSPACFFPYWVKAMNQDKGGDWWLSKDRSEINVPVMLAKEFLGGLTRAWCTGLLLNLTQVNTISQAAQLGFFLYFAVLVPTVVSDNIWEKRSMQLLKFKLMASLSNIVVMACIMHLVGTR